MKTDGQASIEAVAGVAALLLAALVCLQMLAAGYALAVVDGAAEAGAAASVRGRPVSPAVADALPGWAHSRFSVSSSGGRVRVTLRPLSLLSALADGLEVSSTAAAS